MADAENKVSPQAEAARIGSRWSFGSGVVGSLASLFGAYQQHKWQQQAYDRQLADNLAQWRRENEYDSPAAQMARMRQAGLNPDLMYGDVSPAGATISKSMPSMQQFENPMSGAASILQMTGAQIANIQADSRLKEAQANNLDKSSGLLTAQTAREMAETLPHELYVRLAEGKNAVDEATAKKIVQEAQNCAKQFEILGEQLKGQKLDNFRKQWENDADKIIKDIQIDLERNKLQMSNEDVKHYVDLLLATIDEKKSNASRNYAESEKAKSEKTVIDAQHEAKVDNSFTLGGYTVNGYGVELLNSFLSAAVRSDEGVFSDSVSRKLGGNFAQRSLGMLFYLLTHIVNVSAR